jgi:hypothetical protein
MPDFDIRGKALRISLFYQVTDGAKFQSDFKTIKEGTLTDGKKPTR